MPDPKHAAPKKRTIPGLFWLRIQVFLLGIAVFILAASNILHDNLHH